LTRWTGSYVPQERVLTRWTGSYVVSGAGLDTLERKLRSPRSGSRHGGQEVTWSQERVLTRWTGSYVVPGVGLDTVQGVFPPAGSQTLVRSLLVYSVASQNTSLDNRHCRQASVQHHPGQLNHYWQWLTSGPVAFR
jgi:hypothetical protein